MNPAGAGSVGLTSNGRRGGAGSGLITSSGKTNSRSGGSEIGCGGGSGEGNVGVSLSATCRKSAFPASFGGVVTTGVCQTFRASLVFGKEMLLNNPSNAGRILLYLFGYIAMPGPNVSCFNTCTHHSGDHIA